jgi:hypothetical protein
VFLYNLRIFNAFDFLTSEVINHLKRV